MLDLILRMNYDKTEERLFEPVSQQLRTPLILKPEKKSYARRGIGEDCPSGVNSKLDACQVACQWMIHVSLNWNF